MIGKTKDYESLSDEDLVLKITQKGLTDLYSILYKRYYLKVLRKCDSLVNDKDLSKVLAHDILSGVFEKLNSFQGKSSFNTWVYSITYNHCIDYLRSNKRLHYPEWNRLQQLPEIVDVTEEDLTDLHYSRILELLDQLHTEEKAMLLMKYKDNLSIKEIANSMRLTESSVRLRLMRARVRLVFNYKSLYGSYP